MTQSGEKQWLYGGTEPSHTLASKSGLHELKSLTAWQSTEVAGLRYPLVALIDYKGFRVLALSLLPVNKSTLRCGSADAARTVHNEDPILAKMIAQAASKLNLAPHVVGASDGSASYTLTGPGDLEGHKGHDNRYYLVDVSRTFPAQPPPLHSRAFLYNLLRPEFVRRWTRARLSSDAFSRWQCWDPRKEELDQDVTDASTFLVTVTVKQFAAFLDAQCDRNGNCPEDLKLVENMHRRGINVRHMGVVYSLVGQERIRDALRLEMTTRAVKIEMKEAMVQTMESVQTLCEEPFKETVLGILNKYIGTHYSAVSWCDLEKKINEKFEPGFRITVNPDNVDFCKLAQSLQEAVGFTLSPDANAELADGNRILFVSSDVLEVEAKVKHTNIVECSEALALFMSARRQQGIGESARLLRVCNNKFQRATLASPDNTATLFQWGASIQLQSQLTDDTSSKVNLLKSACEKFASAIEIDPEFCIGHLALGQALLEICTGKRFPECEQAAYHLKRALELNTAYARDIVVYLIRFKQHNHNASPHFEDLFQQLYTILSRTIPAAASCAVSPTSPKYDWQPLAALLPSSRRHGSICSALELRLKEQTHALFHSDPLPAVALLPEEASTPVGLAFGFARLGGVEHPNLSLLLLLLLWADHLVDIEIAAPGNGEKAKRAAELFTELLELDPAVGPVLANKASVIANSHRGKLGASLRVACLLCAAIRHLYTVPQFLREYCTNLLSLLSFDFAETATFAFNELSELLVCRGDVAQTVLNHLRALLLGNSGSQTLMLLRLLADYRNLPEALSHMLESVTALDVSHTAVKDSDISAIATGFPRLRMLNVNNCILRGESLPSLTKLTYLEELRCAECLYITFNAWQQLNTIPASLLFLDLSKDDVKDTTVSYIARDCRRLETLLLNGCCNITTAGIARYLGLMPRLVHLGLNYSSGVHFDAVFSTRPALGWQTLLLRNHRIALQTVSFDSLCTLNLRQTAVGDAFVTSLSSCPAALTLVKLNLSYTAVTYASVPVICTVMTNLQELCLNLLLGEHTGELRQLHTIKSLAKLTLAEKERPHKQTRGIDDETAIQLASSLHNLTYINLSYCEGLTKQGLATFLKKATSLRTLKLSGCRNVGELFHCELPHLSKLDLSGSSFERSYLLPKFARNLEYLNVSRCRIQLQCIGQLTNLQFLKLHWCAFAERNGLSVLSRLTKLRVLILGGARLGITQDPVSCISKAMTDLRSLDLSFVEHVTNESLAEIANLRSLTTVDLSDTAVTLDGIEELTRQCPGLRVKKIDHTAYTSRDSNFDLELTTKCRERKGSVAKEEGMNSPFTV
eukprot:TRINITY_DN2116_c0_g1_i3.p1 TRINITY_DN2116_c0_g1~~TRINITY_DN2116_c0_g1_i3.p1  ORF type:complete len:1509 (-),score=269.33 TRINITY_DN2116_c0_g1_i3:281-4252(-)